MQTENKKKTTTKKQNKKKTNKSMPLHKLKVYIDPPQSIETNPGEICFITDTMTSDPNAKFFQRKTFQEITGGLTFSTESTSRNAGHLF